VAVALTLRGVLLVRAAKCVSGYPRLKGFCDASQADA
jgi:hypothetical protein